MKRALLALIGTSALTLSACSDFEILLGKSDDEVATVVAATPDTNETAAPIAVAEDPASGDQPIFIKGADILAMDGTPAGRGRVLIDDGIIVAVGSRLKAPDDARVIDADGLVLMPGLVDMHVHHFSQEEGPLYLINGITTVRNLWGTNQTVRLDEGAKYQNYPGPRVYTPGPLMDGPEPIWGEGSLVVTSPEMARGAVRAQKAAGFTAVKLYEKLTEEIFVAAVEEAKAADMQVYAHTPLDMTVDEVIALGVDSLEHLNNVQDLLVPDDYAQPDDYNYLETWAAADNSKMAALAKSFAEAGVANSVTFEVTINRYAAALDPDAYFASERGQFVPQGLKEWWMQSAERTQATATTELIAAAKEKQLAFVKALYDANAPLLIGTDTPNPFVVAGFSLHGEIETFSEAGLPNEAILSLATREAAQFLGQEETFGQVAKGLRADLILVGGDPEADLSVLQNPEAVIASGVYYDRAALDQMRDDARARAAASYTDDN
ncbi:MAG: amidohydrolase family protein [Pseudomonadota bacterium]